MLISERRRAYFGPGEVQQVSGVALVLAEGDLAEWGVTVLRVGVFRTPVGLGQGGTFVVTYCSYFSIVVIFCFMQYLFWNGNVMFTHANEALLM